MYLIVVILNVAVLILALLGLSARRGRSKIYLAQLDLISYILTSATVLMLVMATQGQINQIFIDATGKDKDLFYSRAELYLFLEEGCGREPECAAVKREIVAIANPRGISKSPSRVNSDVSRIPELAARVAHYNSAFDQRNARANILFFSLAFWISSAALCGVVIGIWRRTLVLREAIADQKT
ncbi:hypothetical protein [Gemmobacter megaterium]|uniref:hypothetical protein n=1 Tax=Gemmobacter megaterium TaxID=1086013 RepID=UPI001181AD0C|nr:hypothetical protein [Gemmobacter megaterium]